MEKPAQTTHPIHDLLRRRWSPRTFADRAIEPHKIRCLFEAVRWSASSFNEQPWSFMVATRDDPEDFDKALSCLVEANRLWARLAPMLILTTSKRTFSHNGKPNRVYIHDLGLAAANLTIQAVAMGLFVHQMAGIDAERVRQVYAVPEDHEPVTGIAVGYPGELARLPQNLQQFEQAPRTRKLLNQFVFASKFGDGAPIVAPP